MYSAPLVLRYWTGKVTGSSPSLAFCGLSDRSVHYLLRNTGLLLPQFCWCQPLKRQNSWQCTDLSLIHARQTQMPNIAESQILGNEKSLSPFAKKKHMHLLAKTFSGALCSLMSGGSQPPASLSFFQAILPQCNAPTVDLFCRFSGLVLCSIFFFQLYLLSFHSLAKSHHNSSPSLLFTISLFSQSSITFLPTQPNQILTPGNVPHFSPHLSSGWGSPKLWSSPAVQCPWCQWHILGVAWQLFCKQPLVWGLQVCAARNTRAPSAALHISIWSTAHPSSMGRVSLSQVLWSQLITSGHNSPVLPAHCPVCLNRFFLPNSQACTGFVGVLPSCVIW